MHVIFMVPTDWSAILESLVEFEAHRYPTAPVEQQGRRVEMRHYADPGTECACSCLLNRVNNKQI